MLFSSLSHILFTSSETQIRSAWFKITNLKCSYWNKELAERFQIRIAAGRIDESALRQNVLSVSARWDGNGILASWDSILATCVHWIEQKIMPWGVCSLPAKGRLDFVNYQNTVKPLGYSNWLTSVKISKTG